ncbi:unnamed protein product [Staurois parvus]|uniref:Ig-like domain-containing protein n=1 Tax=Staurois parvus TaxID=386267 RepID=A0ABN9H4J0_9NEOB|nr:unnamed protein product [Staurois parvus]
MAITQTPDHIAVSPGGSVTITCKLSSSTSYLSCYLSWYQLISGQSLKPLIYKTNQRYSGISERFSGSKSGNDFTLTISKVEEQDEAIYCCHYTGNTPFTQ